MTKKNLMPAIVLSVICIVVAGLLAVVNLFTAPIIEEMESQKVYDSLREVLDGKFEDLEKPEGTSENVNAIYKVTDDAGKTLGHVVTLTVKGYAGDISLTVGIDAAGAVTKAVVTNESETHGKSGMDNYTDGFTGATGATVSGIDTFTGATKTSTAIKNAVIIAINTVTGSSVEAPGESVGEEKPEIELPKTDAELLTLAGALVSGASGFEDVTPEKRPETLGKLYRETSGKGYVAYVWTPGEYVPVANEALVHINLEGNIVAVNHLTWIVGHGVSADGFADRFVGEDNWSVGEVELITSATVTSGDLRAAIADAVLVVTKLVPRSEGKVLELVDELVPNSHGFDKVTLADGAPETLKALYRERGESGYVAYIVTTGWGGAIVTESLVWFDTLGTIRDARLLIWNVGHGVEPGDFAEQFVGKTKATAEGVELVTSATGTSGDLKAAIIASFDFVPTHFPVARVVGIAVIAVATVISCAMYFIISRRRRNR
ncbi:MAG: FMN-binding protein [Clostridia bacterium]|nr:FMN-binding protein [Clostridia bacterium]